MSSSGADEEHIREVNRRWRALGWQKRWGLIVRGERPGTQNEAVTTLGYARQMLRRGWVWGLFAALSAFVVVLAVELLIQRSLTTTSFILAGGIGVGVGVGLAVGGRSQARRLHEHAEAVLARSSIE